MSVLPSPGHEDNHPVTLREATLSDSIPASQLLSGLGLKFPRDPDDIRRYWEWLWVENPASKQGLPKAPIGWVMESEGVLVGFFGNIPMRYHWGGQTLFVAVASSWGVAKPFRVHTNELARKYFSQNAADLLLGTTAGYLVGRIFARFDMAPMPQREYDEVLYWVLDSEEFVRAAFRRRHTHRLLAEAGALVAAPALAAAIRLQGRRLGRRVAGLDPEVISLADIDDEFDDLWRRKTGESRLYAYRQAADLRWHFTRHNVAGTLTVIRCRRAGLLNGYLAMVREEVTTVGLRRAKIVDLFVDKDDPAVIEALLFRAADVAEEQNCHVLEAVGFPASIRAQLRNYRPFMRRFADFPVHFKARSPTFQAALQNQHAWYPTLYDGDSSLY